MYVDNKRETNTMAKMMSAEYWSAAPSKEYEAITDKYFNQGVEDAANGRPVSVHHIPSQHRCFYMSAYRATLAAKNKQHS